MNFFKQHIPRFIDTERTHWKQFETTDDLLNLPEVKKYTTWDKFHRFVINKDHLMIESEDKSWWWVCGYIKDPGNIDLPKWEKPE